MNRRILTLAAALLAAIAIGSVAVGGAAAGRSDLTSLRAATARFNDIGQAGPGGYGQPPAPAPLHECISSFNNTGAMGFHYINGGLLDDKIEATRPEVLVYAPDSTGKRKLVAVEYVVFQDAWKRVHGDTMPELFGQMFMATGSPNRFDIPAFYSLHVWLWQDNPAGLFAPFNPTVSCDGQRAAAIPAKLTTAAVDRAKQFACAIRSGAA
ncbi:MAG TPA: hypothetical protein VGC90_03940 [Candidatus Limnocylindrales bacterium]|jgi:hypothetical protein